MWENHKYLQTHSRTSYVAQPRNYHQELSSQDKALREVSETRRKIMQNAQKELSLLLNENNVVRTQLWQLPLEFSQDGISKEDLLKAIETFRKEKLLLQNQLSEKEELQEKFSKELQSSVDWNESLKTEQLQEEKLEQPQSLENFTKEKIWIFSKIWNLFKRM